MPNMRIYHQSFTVLQNLPAYAEALRAHFARVARPDTEVVMHGMHQQTYQTEYPGNDIRYGYFQTLHSQQFVLGAIEAEEQGFDAFALMTLPEPSLGEIRSLVDIPVVGYCESAMLTATMLGARAGVLLFIEQMTPMVARNVERMGLGSRFAGAHFVGFTFNDVLAGYADAAPLLERFRAAAAILSYVPFTSVVPVTKSSSANSTRSSSRVRPSHISTPLRCLPIFSRLRSTRRTPSLPNVPTTASKIAGFSPTMPTAPTPVFLSRSAISSAHSSGSWSRQ